VPDPLPELLIEVLPAAPGPDQLNTTDTGESSSTRAMIVGVAMGGHVGSGEPWMMDTRGERSTTARSVRSVPPDALMTTRASAGIVPSGAAARSTTMSTALDVPGPSVPAVDDTPNGAIAPEIDQFSGWPPLFVSGVESLRSHRTGRVVDQAGRRRVVNVAAAPRAVRAVAEAAIRPVAAPVLGRSVPVAPPLLGTGPPASTLGSVRRSGDRRSGAHRSSRS